MSNFYIVLSQIEGNKLMDRISISICRKMGHHFSQRGQLIFETCFSPLPNGATDGIAYAVLH